MAKAKNKGFGFFGRNAENPAAEKKNTDLNTISDSELDIELGFIDETESLGDIEAAVFAPSEGKEESILNNTDFEGLDFAAESAAGTDYRDDLFEIKINFNDEHVEKLDFDALGSFIDRHPQNRAAQNLESDAQPAVDMSISFDEDDTDVIPAGGSTEEDDGIIPEEQPVLRGRAKPAESIESFLTSLGIEYSEAESEAEVREDAAVETDEAAPAEPEATVEEPDDIEEPAVEEVSEVVEPVAAEEPEKEEAAPEIEENFNIDAVLGELIGDFEPVYEEPQLDEIPVEEAASVEEEAPVEGETSTEDEAVYSEPEAQIKETFEELGKRVKGIFARFGFGRNTVKSVPVEAETEVFEDYSEEIPEPEQAEPENADEPEENAAELVDADLSFETIAEELGLDLPEEEEAVEETAPAEEEAQPEEEAFAEPDYEEQENEEPEPEDIYVPAAPLDEYDFFAAQDEEEVPPTEEKKSDGFFDDDGEDDNYGLSEAQLRAIEHAREMRESGFSFDYEPSAETRDTVLAEELLGFDDSDDTPEEEAVRPNIGIAYGVEEEDFGLAEEHVVERDAAAPVLPEKKSFLNSVLGRFNFRKQPVYAEETPTVEEAPAPEVNEPVYTETYEATEEQPFVYAEEAAETVEEALPVTEIVEEAAETAAVGVQMAAGFSAAELAAAHAAELRDDETQKTDYAEKREYTSDIDYDYNDPDGDSYGEDNTVDDFPSFREFVVADISAFMLRIGAKKNLAATTVAEDNEDLGPEWKPMDAMRYYGSFRDTLRKRCIFAVPMLLLMVLLSLGLPLPGMLKNTATVAAALLAMQLTVMLIALDVVTNAVMNAVRGKIGADALAVIACIATSFDAILVIKGIATAHVPLCLFSSLSVTGILFSSMLTTQALRKTFRVPAIGKKTYVMTAENELTDKGTVTLLKSTKSIKGFVRRSEEAAPDEWAYLSVAPYLLIAVAVLALIVTAITRDFSKFIYTFSAVLAPTVPFTAVVCFAMPFFISAIQIFSSGAAIAGWSGANEIGRSREIVITDRDLFPESHVRIQDVRLFNDVDADSTVAYVGTIIVNSGSCLAPAFENYMKTYGIAMRPVEGYEYLPGGGLKGIIDSNVVLLGNADMMRLMGIAVKSSLIKPNTIAIAVNNCLYGFIDVEYTPDDSVREALVKLMASNRHPIFAIRDFNITPALIRDLYDVPTDGYDFPSYIERFRLSSAAPDESSLPAAVLCTEGLAPLTRTANAGRSVYVATRANMWITAIGAVVGAIIAAVQIMSAGVVTVSVMAIFSVLIALPVLIISAFMKI